MELKFNIGPHRGWAASICHGGEVLEYEYGDKAHTATWRNGAQAKLDGKPFRSPYAGRDSLGSRGFSNAWRNGYNAMARALASASPESSHPPEPTP